MVLLSALSRETLSLFARGFLEPALIGVSVAALFLTPLVIVAWRLHRRRKRFRQRATEPFTELPLRPPGETLRKKLEALSDQFNEELSGTFFTWGVVGAVIATSVLTKVVTWPVVAAASAIQLVAAVLMWKKLSRLQRELWAARLGFDGERIVGEYLNRLMADGFEVFHDLPFDGYNVDHVIVGPPGVFAIETKTRRKPKELKGTAKATVIYDGTALHFPNRLPDVSAIEQAARNAKTVAKFLSLATGEPVAVKPILALPGWYVDRRARGEVNVLNAREIRYSFPTPESPLAPEQIKRIAYQLTERCRLARLESTPSE